MRPFALDADMWSFEMEADNPIHTQRRYDGIGSSLHDLRGIGDERWEERRRAPRHMCRPNDRETFRSGEAVEKDAPSPIDLSVKEPGGGKTVDLKDRRTVLADPVGWCGGDDVVIADANATVLKDGLAIEQLARAKPPLALGYARLKSIWSDHTRR